MRRLVTPILLCLFVLVINAKVWKNNKGNEPKPDTVTIDDVKGLKRNSTVLLIDVREPEEISNTGKIPGSINIPMDKLHSAFEELNEDEFKVKYGRPQPDLDTPLIFTCKKGIRSKKAMDLARGMGFRNVRYYPGSWLEWAKDQILN